MHFDTAKSPAVNRWIIRLGGLNLLAVAVYTVLTYGLFPLAPFEASAAADRVVLANQLGRLFSVFGPSLRAYVTGDSMLAQRGYWLLAYSAPLVMVSVIFTVMLVLLARHKWPGAG